jgi:RND superfamily putative drug exporter
MLTSLGTSCARHRWLVIIGWAVAIAAVVFLGQAYGGEPDNGLTLSGTSSQEALDLLESDFPAAAGATADVIYHTPSGTKVTDADVAAGIEKTVANIKEVDGVSTVLPVATPSPISEDGRTAAAVVLFTDELTALPDNGTAAFDDLEKAIDPTVSDTLSIELGGVLPGTQPIPSDEIFTLYGIIAALIVLLIVLGTWTAFAWPVVGALAGIGIGVSLLRLLQSSVSVPAISATAGIMVGLGVGIDYGLFVVGRYKDYVDEGDEPHEAIGNALSTAGRAVLTAGATVILALGALFVFDVPAVTAMAYAIVIFVVCVILAAVTLLPAILSVIGSRIADHRTPVALRLPEDEENRGGIRWSRFVTRRSVLSVALGVSLLLVLATPVFAGDFRLGPLDTSLYPEDSTQYKAWELQSEAFGPGSPNPFLIVVQIPADDSDADSQIATLKSDLSAADGVAFVSNPRDNSDGTVAVLQVIPTTDAQAEATSELVTRLRDDTIPKATDGTDLDVFVSGINAVFVDLDARILDRLPMFIGLVVLIALLILGAVFKSVLIPIKAAVLNLLVIGATYGVTVLVFTNGFALSLLGVPAEVPILSLLAPVIFAMLFGLSNDYEVYLVTRTREELDAGESPAEAVALGVGRGAHIVIGAAMIMVFVFASYIFQPGTSVIQFGFAMTVAILLDAAVARMLLLPALMHLGGGRMWWPGRSSTAPTRRTPRRRC